MFIKHLGPVPGQAAYSVRVVDGTKGKQVIACMPQSPDGEQRASNPELETEHFLKVTERQARVYW